MKSNHISIRQPISIVAIVLLFGTCKNNDHLMQTSASATNTLDTVAVFVLKDTSASKSIIFPAELLPYEQVELFARVQGYLKEIKVDIGDRVRRGETLAVIEAPELQTRYAEFQSSLQAAKAKYMSSADVFQRLYKASQAKTAGIVAPVELERSRNQMLADSAAFEASKKLTQSYKEVAGYLILQAPFDGIITARNADPGALAGTNQVVLKVQNNRTLRLRIAVPELYIAANTANREAVFSVDAYPEKLFSATLSRKSGSIDPATRTEMWEYIYNNKNNDLKAGSFAYVKLNLARAGYSFVVQPTVISTNQERKFVIRVKEGKAEWVDVRQGMSTDNGIEIFGNLHKGDTLIVRATDERKTGSAAYWKMAK